MKTSKLIHTAASAIWMVAPLILNAQPGIDSDNRPNKQEKLEVQRIGIITRKLDLSSEEAQKFWPVYNNFVKGQENLRNNFQKEIKAMKKEPEQMKDEDFARIVENQLSFRQKMLDLRKDYYHKLKPVLPASKIARLYEAEKEFRKSMAMRKEMEKDVRNKEPKPIVPPIPPLLLEEDEE